jgi:hypothetical protein
VLIDKENQFDLEHLELDQLVQLNSQAKQKNYKKSNFPLLRSLSHHDHRNKARNILKTKLNGRDESNDSKTILKRVNFSNKIEIEYESESKIVIIDLNQMEQNDADDSPNKSPSAIEQSTPNSSNELKSSRLEILETLTNETQTASHKANKSPRKKANKATRQTGNLLI